MIQYVKQNRHTFEQEPLQEVDALILAWLSYMNFPKEEMNGGDGLELRDLFRAEWFEKLVRGMHSQDETLELLTATAASPRYRNIRLTDYKQFLDHDSAAQFAAVTFDLGNGYYYVAYRGTDCTIVGWKEDFYLTLDTPVVSQTMSVEYLEQIVGKYGDGTFYVGGHSKGGNLAVYASAKVTDAAKDKIAKIYSFDGPGFQEEDLADKGFDVIRDRICKTIPQSSMIGMIFIQECEYQIVKSNAKSVMQHNPFSWEIKDGKFVMADKLTTDAKVIYRTLNNWIAKLDQEERRTFIRVIFDILDETGAESFHEFGADLQTNVGVIAREIRDLDKKTRKDMINMFGELGQAGAYSLGSTIKDTVKEKVQEMIQDALEHR